jgi:hypothetical protein
MSDATPDAAPNAGESSSDEPDKPNIFERAFDSVTERIDQKHPWYKLPKPLGLLELIGIRNTLREKNLYDTSRQPSVNPVQPPPSTRNSAPSAPATAAGTTSNTPRWAWPAPASAATYRSTTPGRTAIACSIRARARSAAG